MPQNDTTRSVLVALRALVPPRPLTPCEVRQVLERQTTRLLKLVEVYGPPVPLEVLIDRMPRVTIKRVAGLPSSGRAQWNGTTWVLLVASDEPKVRQRFSLAHELAHVIWHPLASEALPDLPNLPAEQRLEQACEYFAARLLMPRQWMKRAFCDVGIQDVPSLARLFSVSWASMQIRLEELGFVEQPQEIAA